MSIMQPALYLGVVLFNYRLVRKLGSGGFGDVYLAEHVDLGRLAACKVLHAQFSQNNDLVERFFREAKAVCAIGHRAIIDIQNFGRLSSGEPFYLMDYFPGENLSQYRDRVGRVPLAQIPIIFDPLASALAAAHAKGIIHRDLKPDNIMLREENGQIAEIKLVDFGVAKLIDEQANTHTQTGIGMGTPRFMAPEQARDAKSAGPRSDVYGFAATIYTAIAGQPPFLQENITDLVIAVQTQPPVPLRNVVYDAPVMLEQILAQCMAKSPEERPASIEEAWSRIRATLDGQSPMDPLELTPVEHMLPTLIEPPSYQPGFPAANSTLGLANSEVQRPRSRDRDGFQWTWAAAAMGLVSLGILAVLAVMTISGDNGTPQIAMVASDHPDDVAGTEVDAMHPDPADITAAGTRDAATSAEASPENAERLDTISDDAALDCSESSFTSLYERKLDHADARQTIERLDACLGASKISKEFHEQARARIASHFRSKEPTPERSSSTRKTNPPSHVRNCSIGSFERIYQRATPSSEEINSALTRLKQCHKRNAIDSASYVRIQKALIDKL